MCLCTYEPAAEMAVVASSASYSCLLQPRLACGSHDAGMVARMPTHVASEVRPLRTLTTPRGVPETLAGVCVPARRVRGVNSQYSSARCLRT